MLNSQNLCLVFQVLTSICRYHHNSRAMIRPSGRKLACHAKSILLGHFPIHEYEVVGRRGLHGSCYTSLGFAAITCHVSANLQVTQHVRYNASRGRVVVNDQSTQSISLLAGLVEFFRIWHCKSYHERKSAALAWLRVHLNLAAHAVNQPLADGQAQTDPAVGAGRTLIHLSKRIEKRRQVVL